MEVSVPFPQEVTFLVLKIYLTARHDKIIASESPSQVEAKLSGYYLENGRVKQEILFGSWRGFLLRSKGNAKGKMKATIEKMEGGSRVLFDLNFMKEYKPYLIIIGALFIILNGMAAYDAITNPSSKTGLALFVIFNFVLLFFGGFGIFSVFYNTVLTKSTFIEGFREMCKQVRKKKNHDKLKVIEDKEKDTK